MTGVVGVGTSPTCGVTTTVDMAGALTPLVGCPPARLDRSAVNTAVANAARAGSGVFVDELRRALHRRGLNIAFTEHDLRTEWPANTAASSARNGTDQGSISPDAG